MMYTVEYHKNNKPYCYETFEHYYKIVNNDGKYELEEEV